MIPSDVALSWIVRTTVTISSIDAPGKALLSSRTKKLDSSARPGEAEQRERQEEQRHEREQREVGDHRREVRAAVGEELGEGLAEYALC